MASYAHTLYSGWFGVLFYVYDDWGELLYVILGLGLGLGWGFVVMIMNVIAHFLVSTNLKLCVLLGFWILCIKEYIEC